MKVKNVYTKVETRSMASVRSLKSLTKEEAEENVTVRKENNVFSFGVFITRLKIDVTVEWIVLIWFVEPC